MVKELRRSTLLQVLPYFLKIQPSTLENLWSNSADFLLSTVLAEIIVPYIY